MFGIKNNVGIGVLWETKQVLVGGYVQNTISAIERQSSRKDCAGFVTRSFTNLLQAIATKDTSFPR